MGKRGKGSFQGFGRAASGLARLSPHLPGTDALKALVAPANPARRPIPQRAVGLPMIVLQLILRSIGLRLGQLTPLGVRSSSRSRLRND